MYTINHIMTSFSPSNPQFLGLLVSFILANSIGMFQYFWAVSLTIKEKKGPFPVWMHTFFLAHDSTAAIIFTILAFQHHFFWVFTLFAIGMYVWTIMEIYCLSMDIKYSREEEWGGTKNNPVTTSFATSQVIQQTLVMYCIIFLLRFLTKDPAMFIWLPLTNFVMAIGPGYMLNHRKSRSGSCVFIYILIVIGTFLNFAPKGLGLFSTLLPDIFNQPLWFFVGIVSFVIAVYNLIRIIKLPKKDNSLSNIW